jgi:hypothetical protein
MDNPSFPQPQITCWAPRACGLRAPPGNAPRCRAATGPPRRSRGRSVDFHYFNPRVPILWTDGGDRATAAPREGSDAHGFLIPPARTEREREREGPAREQMQRTPSSHYSFRICSTPTPSAHPHPHPHARVHHRLHHIIIAHTQYHHQQRRRRHHQRQRRRRRPRRRGWAPLLVCCSSSAASLPVKLRSASPCPPRVYAFLPATFPSFWRSSEATGKLFTRVDSGALISRARGRGREREREVACRICARLLEF